MRRRVHADETTTQAKRVLAERQDAREASPVRGGNQVATLFLQPKLTVGPAGDAYEQEADRVARRVVTRLRAQPPSDAATATTSDGADGAGEVRLRAQPGATGIGVGGGTLDSTTEASIRHAGGGAALPTGLRAQMEQAFGADFSAVRVHADRSSDGVARSLSADAFTSGRDIFFRNGQYQPDSAHGQETLAHELTHVVQQRGAGGPIRRRWRDDVWTTGRVHLYEYELKGQGTTGKAYELLADRKDTVEGGTKVEADDNPEVKAPDAKKPKYTIVKHGGVKGAVKADSLSFGKAPKKSSGASKVAAGGGEVLSTASAVFDSRASGLDKGSALRDKQDGWMVDRPGNTDTAAWQEKHGMEVLAGETGSVSDLIAIAGALKGWKSKSKSEKAVALLDAGASGASLGANVTKMIDSGAKTNKDTAGGIGDKITVHGGNGPATTNGGYETTASDMAGKTTGNIADFAGLLVSVKDVFFKVKDAYSIWVKGWDDSSKGEKARAAADLAVAFLSTVKSAVSTARNLMFTLENAWNAALGTALPGLGLAIAGLQLVFHAYDMVKDFRRYRKMQAQKRATKGKLAAKWQMTDKLDHKQIAAKKQLLEQDLAAAATQPEKDDLQAQLDEVEDYEISRAFERTNVKSVRRQALNISVDFMNIAGDIATLSGVGAHAGVALKAAAGATKLAQMVARPAKQFGRDQAAKRGGVLAEVFNADKSTANKMKQRNEIADRIYDRLINLAAKVEPYDDLANAPVGLQQELLRLRDYVRAAGLSWKSWMKGLIKDPEAAHQRLVTGMATRG